MSMTSQSTTEQNAPRKFRRCRLCRKKIDVTDNPHGAVRSHQYYDHPEIRAKVDEQLELMHARQAEARKKGMQKQPEEQQPPSEKPAAAPAATAPITDNVTEEVMAELRRQEAEEEEAARGGNGADPGGNGHQDIDAGDAENIFLRTAMNPAQRTRAMIPKMMRADSLGEASIAAIVPKTIVINPMLLQIAIAIAINEWGWDPKLPPSVMLDEFLKWLFWYCGWEITPYRRLTPQEMGIVVTEGGG